MRTALALFTLVLLSAAPVAQAQCDLPLEVYGEPLAFDYSDLLYTHPYNNDISPLYCPVARSKSMLCMSPDGQLLAYSPWDTDLINQKIYVIPSTGGKVNLGFDLKDRSYPYPVAFIPYLSFLPDNRRLVYCVGTYGATFEADTLYVDGAPFVPYMYEGGFGGTGGTLIIATVDIHSGEQEVLVEGGKMLVVDPSGKYILFTIYGTSENEREWVLYDLDTGGQVPVRDILGVASCQGYAPATDYYTLQFSPDGSELYYNKRDGEGIMQIYRTSISGSATEQVTHFPPRADSPDINFWSMVISPDGNWLGLDPAIGYNSVGFQLVYDTVNDRLYNPFTREEVSLDFGAVVQYADYEENISDAMIWGPYSDGSEFVYYIKAGPSETEVEYDYYQFHLVYPSLIGWTPDGETMAVHGGSAIDDVYLMPFDPSTFGQPVITRVEDPAPTAIPVLTSYPNPFNPSTTISFVLPEGGFTELAVYNIMGQKIRTLIAGELTPSIHEVIWDGCDDSGNPVSSGIFVSRLAAGDAVVTNRMTLVK